METITILLLIVIVILIIVIVVTLFFVFRKTECSSCDLSYSFQSFPNTQINLNPIYQDSVSLEDAQTKCIGDQNCASIVRYNSENFYYTSGALMLRTGDPGKTLYVKQPTCSF